MAEDVELMIELWIWWAELTIELQKEGEVERWTMKSLELASQLIDEGYLKVHNGVVCLAKTPPMQGWEAVMRAPK